MDRLLDHRRRMAFVQKILHVSICEVGFALHGDDIKRSATNPANRHFGMVTNEQ